MGSRKRWYPSSCSCPSTCAHHMVGFLDLVQRYISIIQGVLLFGPPHCQYLKETLPKAQRTWGLSSAYQSNFFRLYHKFLHKSWSNIFRISNKHQLQNNNQISAFRQNLNLASESRPRMNFITTTKHQQQNNDQSSASKSCLNINLKILNKPWNLVLKVQTKT